MNVSVVKIGNSRGIRLSKTLIEKYNIKDTVELVMGKDYITIKPKAEPRKDWEKAFKKMHETGDDQLLMPDVFDNETFDEWK
jgi:antitoxin MazE